MKLLESVIVGPELTAIMMRLFLRARLTAETIQRPESRSYSTCGSVTSWPFRTELQKVESLTLRAPRVPTLLKTLMRPFTATSTWPGPTEPIESGGTAPDSLI